MIQGTEEWFATRCGKVTASRVADVIAKTKTGWGASRKNYEAQLIAERLTDSVADSFSNAAMQWGIDTEPKARVNYEFLTGDPVEEIGFIYHPTIPMTGASPDGLVGVNGLVEIKCPNTATHIETLLNKKVPAKHITQMQWQMACCERDYCDFFSYDPRLPEHLNSWLFRVERDDQRISELEELVAEFLDELDEKVNALNNLEKEKVA